MFVKKPIPWYSAILCYWLLGRTSHPLPAEILQEFCFIINSMLRTVWTWQCSSFPPAPPRTAARNEKATSRSYLRTRFKLHWILWKNSHWLQWALDQPPAEEHFLKQTLGEKKIIRTRKPFILSTGYILKQEGGNVLFSPYECVRPVNVREKLCNYEVAKVEREQEIWPNFYKINLCLDLYFIRKF